MHIFTYKGTGGIDSDESNFTRTDATVSDGVATIKRKIFYQADTATEDSIDVLSHTTFPQKYSAHPKHPAYKYWGNCTVQPLSAKSRIWVAELEYSTTNTNTTDSDGGTITHDTPPWKLRPDSIQFTYPDVTMPFEAAYDEKGNKYNSSGQAIVPVVNSAGNKIVMEHNIHNLQMSFTFNTKDWNVENSLKYGDTINKQDVKICGLQIGAERALLLPPEATYLTVYEDNSTKVKWKYWSVTVNIIIDCTGNFNKRVVLDIGDNAIFDQIPSATFATDELLRDAHTADPTFVVPNIRATPTPSPICRFRLTKIWSQNGNQKKYACVGDTIVFCSWEQYLNIRKMYETASLILMRSPQKIMDSVFDLECIQEHQMPLTTTGRVKESVIPGTPTYSQTEKYETKSFRQYRAVSWANLNLPKKGLN